MKELLTPRLRLVPLMRADLEELMAGGSASPAVRDVPLASGLLGPPVERAIGIKLERMAAAPVHQQLWWTYWLIVVRAERRGAGLVGFKGAPNDAGEVEIGYGIAPGYRRRGLATEASARLVEWAFADPICQSVTAWVEGPDSRASERVLEKLGMRRVRQDECRRNWRLDAARPPEKGSIRRPGS